MSHWYEVFDNEEVQYVTRQQAATLMALVSGAAGLSLTLLILVHLGIMPWPVAIALVASSWFLTIVWLNHRLRLLRRVVWCIKLSERRIVGYDYTRQKTEFDWIKVQRVELTPRGMVVVGPDACFLQIPHLFPDFAVLSHRVVYYADLYDVPLYVNGQPWQELDVYALYPFLSNSASSDLPGAASGSAAV